MQDSCIDSFVSQLQVPDVPHGKCAICGKRRVTDFGIWIQEAYKICKTCNLVLHRYVLTPEDATFQEVVTQYHHALLPSGSGFNVTHKVYDYLFVDEEKMKFLVPNIFQDIMHLKRAEENDIHSFNEIVKYELVEEKDSVVIKRHVGVIGRAIAGGIVAGPVGATIGALTSKEEYKTYEYCTSVKLCIHLSNTNNPYDEIVFIRDKTDKNSTVYSDAINAAKKCISIIERYT